MRALFSPLTSLPLHTRVIYLTKTLHHGQLDGGRMTHSFTVLTALPLEFDNWLIALTRWDVSSVTMKRINESHKYMLHI